MHPSPTLTDLAGFTGIRITTLCCALLLAGPASTFAQAPRSQRPVARSASGGSNTSRRITAGATWRCRYSIPPRS
jgi:hypothetical protein